SSCTRDRRSCRHGRAARVRWPTRAPTALRARSTRAFLPVDDDDATPRERTICSIALQWDISSSSRYAPALQTQRAENGREYDLLRLLTIDDLDSLTFGS